METTPRTPSPRFTRGRRWGLVALTAGVGAVVGGVVWLGRPVPPKAVGVRDDPRLTYATPFQNVHPDVKYVGDAACARCHVTHAETFKRHPMGRSLSPVAQIAAGPPAAQVAQRERYDAAAHNPFRAGGLLYSVERVAQPDGRVWHREARQDAHGKTIAQVEAPVEYTLGSGTRGFAYLINRHGRLFQSPISWYSQKRRWDLSPGYAHNHSHFERTITGQCLFCHSNAVAPTPDSVNQFQAPLFRGHAIGCERCHGPGELHVNRRDRDKGAGIDYTIVNPRHLEPALRESICQQCHLQGDSRVVRQGRDLFDFRPGLPLHRFWSIFVRTPEFTNSYKAVSQVEQLTVSRCYKGSGGSLGCTSCHDPHQVPEPDERTAYYRTRCLDCHTDQSCTLPLPVRRQKSQEDSCFECHMPPLSSVDIAHTALSDHRILRQSDAKAPPTAPHRQLRPGEIPLVHFHRAQRADRDPAVARDLGVALVHRSRNMEGQVLGVQLGRLAFPLLDEAVRTWPDDLLAWEARGSSLRTLARLDEAWASYATALALAPQREMLLAEMADFAAEVGRRADAIAYWRRAIAVNPWLSSYHAELARNLAEAKDWPAAAAACQAALKLDPTRTQTRKLLVECAHRLGKNEQARAEFEILLGFDPPDKKELQRWFAHLE